ncbi:MAG: rhodanese-like domain-containing protein [Verrucomicrobiota bacterium]|nr:hypothetical protein [Verrucomicrobiota bacterium]MCC6820126.1 hypothetical protein [Limisphaerales bacterium]
MSVPNPPPVSRPGFTLRVVFGEAAVVVGSGLLLGLLLNAISPRGITLGRDYFPTPPVFTSGQDSQQSAATVSPQTTTNPAVTRLRERGLQPVEHSAAVALFHQSQRTPTAVIFVDVRNDALFQDGHIPSAHQLDYYRPEAYLPNVLAACGTAQQIVVYCTGGDCEDSELAANLLIQLGVPRERIFVYLGGFTEWSANALPLELGGPPAGPAQGGKL